MAIASPALPVEPPAMRVGRVWLRRSCAGIALGYLLGLLLLAVLLRAVGERWWLTALLTYAPRALLGLPLPLLVALLLVVGPRAYLWTQGLAALVLVWPLMGFSWSMPRAVPQGPSLRLLSYNVGAVDHRQAGKLCQVIAAERADVVLLQEVFDDSGRAMEACLQRRYPEVLVHEEFRLASRFEVRSAAAAQPFFYRDEPWGARAMRYRLRTPLGPLALYSVHPGSPKAAVAALRDQGIRAQLTPSHVFGGYAAMRARVNVETRELQFASALEQASRERGRVVVAGDTNLPGLSPVLARHTKRFHDGFASAGRGFGYTFPSKLPFLRLDRILADGGLVFHTFKVSCGIYSDHRCVVAELGLPER